MTIQLDTISSVRDLKTGDKVIVSGTINNLYKDTWYNPGVGGTVLATRDTPFDGTFAYMLLDEPHAHAHTWIELSAGGREAITKAVGTKYEHLHSLRRWESYGRSLVIRIVRDPNYLSPEAVGGLHTCKCGFINKDISVSAIINGKYLCRQCRLIWVK